MFVQCTSTTNQLYIKAAKHSFQVPMPNLPLLLNYLGIGARFLQVSRLTTEGFILIFWLRRVLLPWQQGWLKQGSKMVFVYSKKIQLLDIFSSSAHNKLTLKLIPSVNTVLIKF